ncbi:MAG: DNA-binding response regulator [Flavipsychrobacter sp.]|nr:DNA-binding response regulator [Flavipsychrobacter sp.]
MTILIIEDEKAASTRLRQLIKETEPDAEILAALESVKDAIQWLNENEAPDLILSDIQLADGLSLDIFQQVTVTAPIIFTTAYDAYTLKAFKLNSIDYLLKPIDKEELKAAFAKYHNLHAPAEDVSKKMLELFRNIAGSKASYKSRFLIRQGDRLITIPIDDVAHVRADDKVVFLHTTKGQKHIIDESLDELETMLDPGVFFRINRTYIAPLGSIDKIHNHFNGRLKIKLQHTDDDEIFVSRARATAFKKWLGK